MQVPSSVRRTPLESSIRYSSAAYYGKFIDNLESRGNSIQGKVYAVDSRTIHIRDFEYDGQDSDSVFMAGSSSRPSVDGFVIPNEKGQKNPLSRYNGEHITVTLPEGKTLKDVRWFSIFSRSRGVSLAAVKVPLKFDYPKPQKLSALAGEHLVGSDRIVVVDAQTFLIPNFTYDGGAPDTFFWVGKNSKPSADGIQVPDENGSLDPLRRYDAKTLVLTLPGDLTVFDTEWLSIWCRSFFVDFGHIRIPKKLNVPPSLKMLGVAPQTKLNCEVLFDDLALEVRWALAGESIVMQVVGKLEDNQYMAFGLSGSTTSNRMVGGDVVVAWYDRLSGKGHAEDYFLAAKSQCAGETGVCPDTELQGGINNVRLLNTAVINDFVMITYQRPLRAADRGDTSIFTNQSQAVIWALGPLNSQRRPSYHRRRSERTTLINFGRQPFWNCPYPEESDPTTPRPVKTQPQPNLRQQVNPKIDAKPPSPIAPVTPRPVIPATKPWFIPPIPCHEPEDHIFYAHIGPTGGDQGYSAITGHVGWGIAWYINGLLIPEITVVRGTTYTFVVEGGNNPDVAAKYHPFYITDDPEGGYAYKTPEERGRVEIFAGVRYTREGNAIPTGAGRLCEWQQVSPDVPEKFSSFGAYQRNLKLKCEDGQPGVVRWRPDEDTPDIVYYQCFTHRYLGYRIRVVDRCDTKLQSRKVGADSDLDFYDEDYDPEFDQQQPEGLRISQSQTRPSKPSTMIESNGSDFPKFDFPEFPNFGSFAKEFEPTGNEKDFFQGNALRGSQDQYTSTNNLNGLVKQPNLPLPPPIQKVSVIPRTSERTISKVIADLPLSEPTLPPPSLPPFSSPRNVDQLSFASQQTKNRQRYKPYTLQIDKSKSNQFEDIAYDDDHEALENNRFSQGGYNARQQGINKQPSQTYTQERQDVAQANVRNTFNPSSVVLESGFKPIKNSNGPVPPLGFEVSDQSATGLRKNIQSPQNDFNFDPMFKASELATIGKEGTTRNIPPESVTNDRPHFAGEPFRLDAVPQTAQVNYVPERPKDSFRSETVIQGNIGQQNFVNPYIQQHPIRNGVKILGKPSNPEPQRKTTKKPSFFESMGSFFGFNKRQDKIPSERQAIPPLPSPKPGVQQLPQNGDFKPPPLPPQGPSKQKRPILQQPQLLPFKGELPPPVPISPGNLPQFQSQQRPINIPRPTGFPLAARNDGDQQFAIDDNSFRQVVINPKENEGFSQVMNTMLSFGGENPSRRGSVEDVRIAARQGLPASRSIDLSDYNSGKTKKSVEPTPYETGYLILGDVLSKTMGDEHNSGPDKFQYKIKEREERKLSLRKKRQSPEVRSEDLPMEHRGFDYDVETEVDREASTKTTTVKSQVPLETTTLNKTKVPMHNSMSSGNTRSLSLLLLFLAVSRYFV
ncbi:hypothetical protein QYM36_010890 [Artemia franciscana]|uniref:Protein Skeletor n=1 Tax=Artemia franciscana TaxID=6661 RepID=A0AA88HKI0_ARTSF|nr:hypothetical protein QYM36_010890 [Artemia franciscana]